MDIDLSDDMSMVDNTVTLILISKGTELNVDYQEGTITNVGNEIELKYCSISQLSNRIHGTVRQVFQRGIAIDNDNIEATDVTINIPAASSKVAPKINDELQFRDKDGTVIRSWQILAIDSAAFNSRWRTACRIISRI